GSGLMGTSSTLTLGATNTYTGPTNVAMNAVLAIPTIADRTVACPVGTASNEGAAPTIVLGNGVSRGTLLLTGIDASTDRNVSLSGTYPNGGAIGVSNPTTKLTLTGQVSGSGSLIKNGPGTLTLLNQTNNYTGGAYIEAGTL